MAAAGIDASIGTVGDSNDDALAEAINGIEEVVGSNEPPRCVGRLQSLGIAVYTDRHSADTRVTEEIRRTGDTDYRAVSLHVGWRADRPR